MSLKDYSKTNKGLLDIATNNNRPELAKTVGGDGTFMRQARTPLWNQTPVANPYDAATVLVVVLPDDAKAATLHAAHVRAGTTPGVLVADGSTIEAAPASGHAGVTPDGNLAVLASDAATGVDFDYTPLVQDFDEQIVQVTPGTGAITLPTAWVGRLSMLMEAEEVLPTPGKKIVDAVGTATATGHARMLVGKTGVSFAVADAVTQARVKVGLIPAVDRNAQLEAAALAL